MSIVQNILFNFVCIFSYKILIFLLFIIIAIKENQRKLFKIIAKEETNRVKLSCFSFISIVNKLKKNNIALGLRILLRNHIFIASRKDISRWIIIVFSCNSFSNSNLEINRLSQK